MYECMRVVDPVLGTSLYDATHIRFQRINEIETKCNRCYHNTIQTYIVLSSISPQIYGIKFSIFLFIFTNVYSRVVYTNSMYHVYWSTYTILFRLFRIRNVYNVLFEFWFLLESMYSKSCIFFILVDWSFKLKFSAWKSV